MDNWSITLVIPPLEKHRGENVSGRIHDAIADWLDNTESVSKRLDGDAGCKSFQRIGWFEKRQVLELFEVFRREGAYADMSNATFNQFWQETINFGDWFWQPDSECRRRIGLS
jgi:hypothetical protein